jgi:hypothetical protein
VTSGAAQRATLIAHPEGPTSVVRSIAVEVQLAAGPTLACRYVLEGDLPRVRMPARSDGRRTDGLWRRTCLEAFVATPGASGYYEFNFSPSRDWAAYEFTDYRRGMTAATLVQAPDLDVHAGSERLELLVRAPLAGLTRLRGGRELRLALAAVIEADDGSLTYWALNHPHGKPDFHRPDGFALELRPA